MARIDRIILNVADLPRMTAWYSQALGFAQERRDPGSASLTLGPTRLELRAADGAPYPRPALANDPWFQHFAIAVSDMPAAFAQLAAAGHEPISQGGPQLLPPSTGSVTAYKFRDPEGHPLELSFDPARPRAAGEPPFLAIDHTALAVAEVEDAVAWCAAQLGCRERVRLLNQGPEQDRLDGLPDVRLDIVVLDFEAGPHLELLHYRQPLSGASPRPASPRDIAATVTAVANAPAPHGDVQGPNGHRFRRAP